MGLNGTIEPECQASMQRAGGGGEREKERERRLTVAMLSMRDVYGTTYTPDFVFPGTICSAMEAAGRHARHIHARQVHVIPGALFSQTHWRRWVCRPTPRRKSSMLHAHTRRRAHRFVGA
jgi:hypothetical protein